MEPWHGYVRSTSQFDTLSLFSQLRAVFGWWTIEIQGRRPQIDRLRVWIFILSHVERCVDSKSSDCSDRYSSPLPRETSCSRNVCFGQLLKGTPFPLYITRRTSLCICLVGWLVGPNLNLSTCSVITKPVEPPGLDTIVAMSYSLGPKVPGMVRPINSPPVHQEWDGVQSPQQPRVMDILVLSQIFFIFFQYDWPRKSKHGDRSSGLTILVDTLWTMIINTLREFNDSVRFNSVNIDGRCWAVDRWYWTLIVYRSSLLEHLISVVLWASWRQSGGPKRLPTEHGRSNERHWDNRSTRPIPYSRISEYLEFEVWSVLVDR